jgi:hypothetical protein
MGLVWVVLPMAVFCVVGALLLPEDPPSRALRRVARGVAGRAGRLLAPARRAWRRHHPPPPPAPPDPFEVLALQVRLGLLADQLRVLESDPQVFARARRLMAVRGAYDALLAEACRLAGVELDEDGGAPVSGDHRAEGPLAGEHRAGMHRSDAVTVVSDDERFREEMELASRGWSW